MPLSADSYVLKKAEIKSGFEQMFGMEAKNVFVAPGRVEIIGNHTDHNNGKVISAAVDLFSFAAVSPTADNEVILYSDNFEEETKVDLIDLEPREEEKGTTAALIRGVASKLKRRGYEISGFRARVASEVIPGSGLSSSASFEILMGKIFSGLFNNGKISPLDLSIAGKYAENQFFGKPCGLMDQLAISHGGTIYIDFENPENPIIREVELNFKKSGLTLCVINTGGSHAGLTGEYAAIMEDMKTIAGYFGKSYLCETDDESFYKNIAEIRRKTGERAILRAMHFFEENRRVEKLVKAAREENTEILLSLINQSGDSSATLLQNINSLGAGSRQPLGLALAMTKRFISETGIGACRVHGGGFAGTILALIPEEKFNEYSDYMGAVFGGKNIIRLSVFPGE